VDKVKRDIRRLDPDGEILILGPTAGMQKWYQ
jgi:hypothetical protein